MHPHSAPPKNRNPTPLLLSLKIHNNSNFLLNSSQLYIFDLQAIVPQYTENDILQALIDIKNRQSLKSVIKKSGLPRSTLRGRVKGSEPHSIAAESQQRLSKVQEEHLTQWVLTQEALALPPTHAQIREFAQRVLAIKGDNQPLGKRWIQAFLKRNLILRTKRARTIDSKRINSATIPIIKS